MKVTTSLLLVFIFLTSSCAKSTDAQILSAIKEARYHLTSEDCSSAIDVLDDVGAQKENADYVATYASALACQAGYTDLSTAVPNLSSIGGASAGFLGSLAGFTSSQVETTPNETTYTKLLESIQYILEADDGVNPNTVNRLAYYGAKKGNDLSMQLLLMISITMGKHFALYGNVGSTGIKGAGAGRLISDNQCVMNYTDVGAVAFITGTSPGSCVAAEVLNGSDFLDTATAGVTAAIVNTRLCEGLTLFNNFLDILGGITLSESSTLGSLSTIGKILSDAITASALLETATDGGTSIADLDEITLMSTCEAQDVVDLERWYALIFETIF